MRAEGCDLVDVALGRRPDERSDALERAVSIFLGRSGRLAGVRSLFVFFQRLVLPAFLLGPVWPFSWRAVQSLLVFLRRLLSLSAFLACSSLRFSLELLLPLIVRQTLKLLLLLL